MGRIWERKIQQQQHHYPSMRTKWSQFEIEREHYDSVCVWFNVNVYLDVWTIKQRPNEYESNELIWALQIGMTHSHSAHDHCVSSTHTHTHTIWTHTHHIVIIRRRVSVRKHISSENANINRICAQWICNKTPTAIQRHTHKHTFNFISFYRNKSESIWKRKSDRERQWYKVNSFSWCLCIHFIIYSETLQLTILRCKMNAQNEWTEKRA